ncbi:DUF6122 family protein [Aestuariibaculum sp. M13]|uniref:DUF6122 family protein n=1 Tax=Aestuariibaculum sp. M13 TaxID=2967132 RepID=UPI002159F3E9|nr:DUF6122 family protein [Aestuariibaculum sp. M13]MCR8668447.1 DUF6122 family protein [Aestuariibaculum sp. M13]
MLQFIAHYGCHVLLPFAVALIWYKPLWIKAYLIMLAGFLIDIDHVLATPIFSPGRCSINFHPLHSYYAIVLYVLLLFPKKTRLIGLGLVIHIIADLVDCSFM